MSGRATLESNPARTIRILVVEDENVIARDIKDCLENLGYSVPAIAASGVEAIAKATELLPDLVLMDIRLKGQMDGIQAAEQIWSRLQIPVIYSTGYSDKNTLERAKATAPFGYILKPIEERELYVAIETALQRYQLDAELKKREQWLTTILRNIGDGVIVVDAQSRVKFLNLAAEALTGWQQKEALDKDLSEIFHIIHEQTQAPIQNPVTEVLQTNTIVYLGDYTLLVAKNGTTIPIADSAAPFKDDSGTVVGVVLVFRDLTEHRLAQERNLTLERNQQLELQMAELQRLNELKDDFLSTVSHELRTPLANIKMATHMLEIVLAQEGILAAKTNPETPSSIVRYLEILRNQCQQELSLVNDLLDLQRLNAAAYPLDLVTIQLPDWVFHLVEIFQARAQNRQQSLQVSFGSDLPPLVSDESILTRILTELLNNACKYSPPGEQIAIHIQSVETSQITPPRNIQIRVSNSGVEIPADELPRVFDPFYRVPKTDRWQQGGTGLGLALVKKMVEYMQGSIAASSEQGWTIFTVEIPCINQGL